MRSIRTSVVIPVHNNPGQAVRAVFSVLRQTRPAHEIILVDDCSGEAAARKLDRVIHACRAPVPLRLERLSANAGPGGARHAGANAATGTHVAFLDADDLWHAAKLQQSEDAIAQHGADLVGHDRPWSFRISREALTRLPHDVRIRQIAPAAFLRRNPMPTSSIVARRSIAREMFRFGGRKSEDYMALVIASKMARKIVYVGANLCWASKPPFGHSGAGADQMKIYRASLTNMRTLRRERLISAGEFAVYSIFLAARAPIGLLRHWRYQRLYGPSGGERV